MSVSHYCKKILVWSPLVAMPFILNLRWGGMVAPNEELKWATFVLLGLILGSVGSIVTYLDCRQPPGPGRALGPPRISLAGCLFVLFFLGLGLGTTYTVHPGEGINRLAFWCVGGLTFWVTGWAARNETGYARFLQLALTLSATVLCLHFWYDYFVEFNDPRHNKFVQFSLIGHFNFTADVLMVLIPLLTWTVLTQRAVILRGAAGVSLVTSCFMLLSSGSLGGMGGLMAGGLAVAGGVMARRFSLHGMSGWRPGKRAMLTVLACFALVVVAKPAIDRLPKEFREGMFVRATWWNPPKAEEIEKAEELPPLTPFWMAILPYLGARTPMWASTAGMVAEHPWRGFGTGSYVYEYPSFGKRYGRFGDFETGGTHIKTNPHNVLLQIAADNGIPMAILFSALYLWLTVRVIRQSWEDPDILWRCGAWMVLAAGLDAQVNHVFFNPASLFMAAVGFGLLYGRLPANPATLTFPVGFFWRWPMTPLLASLLSFLIAVVPLKWVVSQYYVAKAVALEPSPQPSSVRYRQTLWEEALRWGPTNEEAMYGLATLYATQGQLPLAEFYLLAFLRLSPNHSVALNRLASIQIGLDKLDEAEATYMKASRLEPDARVLKDNLKRVLKLKQQKHKSVEPNATQ